MVCAGRGRDPSGVMSTLINANQYGTTTLTRRMARDSGPFYGLHVDSIDPGGDSLRGLRHRNLRHLARTWENRQKRARAEVAYPEQSRVVGTPRRPEIVAVESASTAGDPPPDTAQRFAVRATTPYPLPWRESTPAHVKELARQEQREETGLIADVVRWERLKYESKSPVSSYEGTPSRNLEYAPRFEDTPVGGTHTAELVSPKRTVNQQYILTPETIRMALDQTGRTFSRPTMPVERLSPSTGHGAQRMRTKTVPGWKGRKTVTEQIQAHKEKQERARAKREGKRPLM